MGNVTDIQDHLPHMAFEAMCVSCYRRWIAVTPTEILLKKMECPSCTLVGAVINTGQEI